VRAFARSCPGGEIITKMVTASNWIKQDGKYRRIYTNVVAKADLASLEGLDQSAMIFQERVPKALELRVTAVGRRLFSVSVDSQSNPGSSIDWRLDPAAIGHTWKPFPLPRSVERRVGALLEHFGLGYAAIDMVLTPDGRYVFLELNSAGAYHGLERDLGLPISDAIADLLLKGTRSTS
jgi:glutathione synthase/RimK-type ligase-like ATP-grasp enzyme